MQAYDNKDTASSVTDRGSADKAQDRLSEDIPEGDIPEDITEFREWHLRVLRKACEVKDLYSEKLRECNLLLKAGKMTSGEYRKSISVYEKTDRAYAGLLSEAKKTEAELREKYGDKYFVKR